MVIASRTPEGEPAQCPICGMGVSVEPSLFFGDAPCPACGALLWFLRLGAHNILLPPAERARRKGLSKLLAELLGTTESELLNDPSLLEISELDSVQLVELVMKLEDGATDQ